MHLCKQPIWQNNKIVKFDNIMVHKMQEKYQILKLIFIR